jgi:uncharacterized damage-inducible protein DinB
MVEEIQDPRRVDPPFVNDERPMLEAWLEWHRITLLIKCEGLGGEQLRSRPIPTSLMSLHGLVRHMAEVERNWFRRVLAGEDLPTGIYWNDENPDGDFEIPDDDTFEADLAVWQEQMDIARANATGKDLDYTGVRRGEPCSLRWIYAHMIEEYARHNGHADLMRELIDGSVGD